MNNSILAGFKESTVGSLKVKNRFVLPPLDMRMSLFDGTISQNDIEFHRDHSKNVGIDVVGSAFISDCGNTALGSISISRDEDVEGLTLLADTIHQNGARAIIQLVHAGRMTNSQNTLGDEVVAPSAVKATHGVVSTPKELTRVEIYNIINQYQLAAKRAMAAGFDGIEIHGANGFLPQQFLSRLSNQRNDQFGGTLANRLRFAKLLIQSVMAQTAQFGNQNFIVGYRLSPEEFEAGGMTIRESLMLSKELEQLGISYVSLSLHNFELPPRTFNTDTTIVKIFKNALNCPLMIAGKINSEDRVQRALKVSDFIGIGRPLIIDSEWIRKIRYNQATKGKKDLSASRLGVSNQVFKYL